MGVGAGLYMYVIVVKTSRSLSRLLMSSCNITAYGRDECRLLAGNSEIGRSSPPSL